jgi:ABC-type amino acid transport substrate-binding protein
MLAVFFPPSSALLTPVNAALRSMQKDDTLTELYRKWSLADPAEPEFK